MRRLLLGFLCLAGATLCAAELAPLRVVASDLPPFSVATGSDARGALVEVVELIASLAGAPVKVDIVPWKRAMAPALTCPTPRQ